MTDLARYCLESLATAGTLTAAYTLLLDRRTPFRWCRCWLLVSVLLSGVIPLLHIPVWPAEVIAPIPVEASSATTALPPEITPEQPRPGFIPDHAVPILYALGAAWILLQAALQYLRCRTLRRGARIERTQEYTLVRTRRPISTFSFGRSIYLAHDTPEDDLPAILAHETSHIRHRHSSERIVLTALRAALWWNPFVWIASRRLTEVQEFEADRDVLAEGHRPAAYMRTIFAQTFGYSPRIANSLNDSLTKKRFLMMTTEHKSSHALLRLTGTLPVVLALVCTFSLTTRASVIHTAGPEPAVQPAAATDAPEEEKPLLIAEVMPRFQDGDLNAFRRWVMAQIRYPEAAMKANIQGRVVLSFVVERDGRLSTFTILRSPHETLSEEVLRVFGEAPRWTPGEQKGQTVRVKYSIPVDFRLQTPPAAENASSETAPADTAVPTEREPALNIAETMPSFQGGNLMMFRAWAMLQIKYPEEAIQKRRQGRVVVAFTVEADGRVEEAQALQSPDEILSKEAVRVVRLSSGQWSPGVQNGKQVRVRFVVPIDFKLPKKR